MSFLDLASYNSFYRGLEYCQAGLVISCEKVSDTIYRGIVKGSKNYEVEIDIAHPRKSKCNCPFADGKQIICKHKVALYLTIFPEELKRIQEEQLQYELEMEEREKKFEQDMKERKIKIKKYVESLSKEELQKQLINRMINDQYDDVRSQYFDEEEDEWY